MGYIDGDRPAVNLPSGAGPARAPGAASAPRTSATRVGEPTNRLAVDVVADHEAFTALRDEWNALHDAAQSDSVFLRHEWFDAAWRWQAPETNVRILVVRRSDTLVGIWPLARRRRHLGRLRLRSLEFLDVPDTQEADYIGPREAGPDLCRALADWLRRERLEWDVLELKGMRSASGTRDLLLSGLASVGLGAQLTNDRLNYGVALNQPWHAYYSSLSRRLKKGNNLIANHIARAGEATVEWLRPRFPGNALETAIGISARSWKADDGISLDQPGANAFIRCLSAHASRNGWESIWLLYLDGQPCAAEYQLIYRGRVHALRGDFDRDRGELSPGSFLHGRLLEQLFEARDCSVYLMGPGAGTYKMRWSDADAPLEDLRCWNRTLRGHLSRTWELRLKPLARRLLERLARWRRERPGKRA